MLNKVHQCGPISAPMPAIIEEPLDDESFDTAAGREHDCSLPRDQVLVSREVRKEKVCTNPY